MCLIFKIWNVTGSFSTSLTRGKGILRETRWQCNPIPICSAVKQDSLLHSNVSSNLGRFSCSKGGNPCFLPDINPALLCRDQIQVRLFALCNPGAPVNGSWLHQTRPVQKYEPGEHRKLKYSQFLSAWVCRLKLKQVHRNKCSCPHPCRARTQPDLSSNVRQRLHSSPRILTEPALTWENRPAVNTFVSFPLGLLRHAVSFGGHKCRECITFFSVQRDIQSRAALRIDMHSISGLTKNGNHAHLAK